MSFEERPHRTHGHKETRQDLPERRYLFLQGPLSPLYCRVGRELIGQGAPVLRINLCVGDWIYWSGRETRSYRGRAKDWRAYFESLIKSWRPTDLICHGDERFYHRCAIDLACENGIRVYVSEMGLVRPGFMTLQRQEGQPYGGLPKDPKEIQRLAKALPIIGEEAEFPSRFLRYQVLPDLLYNLSNYFLWYFYPRYQKHTLYNPLEEYALWAIKLLGERRAEERASALQNSLEGRKSVFLFPLQLEGDYQIRAKSDFGSMLPALEVILRSFATCAPHDANLVIKEHPLDAGFEKWPDQVARLSAELGCAQRVHFVRGGAMAQWLKVVQGVVTVNSTAGLEAMLEGVPVKALSSPIYCFEGLTDQQPLHDFWRAPCAPSSALLADFVRLLKKRTQVKGAIHNAAGLETAVKSFVTKLSEPPEEQKVLPNFEQGELGEVAS
ncbi:capsule biosynthesis protein [Pseudovibrio exalbescens]|uniref:capsule biosynthesis protein n=1 Tax=Pseudovibrio exalbescens TaxID=197461 RepID=UPI0023668430|nr:capsular biosynthesis protein [Pseudovibrio exalbescens]